MRIPLVANLFLRLSCSTQRRKSNEFIIPSIDSREKTVLLKTFKVQFSYIPVNVIQR